MPRGRANSPTLREGDPNLPSFQESMIFFSMIKHLKTCPEFDWEGIANDCGFKNAETAKVKTLLSLSCHIDLSHSFFTPTCHIHFSH